MRLSLRNFFIFLSCTVTLSLLADRNYRAYAQPYNMINYRREQGFLAANGYALYQDSKGYIWIGTENGLMRFNGREFKLYTTRDGLPDNEVFIIKEDARGRLWLLPFVNAVCYIQNGKLFTAENDPVLRKLDMKARQTAVYFDRFGITWFYDQEGKFTGIDSTGNIKRITMDSRTNGNTWLNARGQVMIHASGTGDEILELSDTGISVVGNTRMLTGNMYFCGTKDVLYNAAAGLIYPYKMEGSRMQFSRHIRVQPIHLASAIDVQEISDNTLFLFAGMTSYIVDIHSGMIVDSFHIGNQVGACIRARDGTLWAGTIGMGIMRFFNTPVKSLKTTIGNPSVVYIKGTDEGVYCTTDRTCFLSARYGQDGMLRQDRIAFIDEKESNTPYVYIAPNKHGDWIACGVGANLIHTPGGAIIKKYYPNHSIKAVLEEGNGCILISTMGGLFRLDKDRFLALDNFMPRKRTTALAKLDTVIYAGTLNGLYACYPDHRYAQVSGESPYLKGHITAMDTGAGKCLWIANNKAKLVGWKDEKIFALVDLQKQRQCNNITCLKISDKFLWVGTDNGLFAISAVPPYKIVRHLTYITGLNSNQVNCLDIHKGRVWVGTATGVNYFDEDDIFRAKDNTTIIINSIKNGDDFLAPGAILQLTNKPLAIDFDVVDFSGGSPPVFEYRINDKGSWAALEGNQLYFPVLPVGTFNLTIRASSPNWKEGAVFRQSFYNPPPYYRTWWFAMVMALVVLATGSTVVFFVIKKIRQRDRNKIAVQQNLLRLEQMALQGQMNPHFIFNCITAIKQRYGSGNTEAADSFVDSFSALIRQTFEMGTETFVSLDRELSYLRGYLEVEAARFNHSFRYHIEQETTTDGIPVPAMLLQPVVENAIRHGIRHLPDGTGEITVRVTEKDGQVIFEVRDNGIGLKRSGELKGAYNHQLLTSSTVNNKRIAILNRLLPDKINMRIEDIPEGGTCVIISYPVNINQHIASS